MIGWVVRKAEKGVLVVPSAEEGRSRTAELPETVLLDVKL